MVSAFSKVGDIDDDEEDRREISERAMAQYAKAQRAYESKASCDEVLQQFEEAEKTMKPLLAGGLASLEPKELETVLKGRLHQAVSLAQQGLPDRWPRIKMLAEDVLQFDFNNAHARWLRGLALHHGFRRPKEAQDECARAVECARLQGKEAEANQWEAEVRKTFAEQPAEGTAEAEAAANAAAVREKTAEVAAPRSSMAKGFLNRTGAKKAPAESTRETDQGPKDAEAAHAAAAATAQRREAELEARVAELTAQLAAAEISRSSEEERWAELAQEIKELPEDLPSLPSSGGSERLSAVAEKLHAGHQWAEKEQQRLVDVSTELLTLQQMTVREAREQEDSAEQRCGELKSLAQRLGELLKKAKALNSMREDEVEEDVAKLSYQVASFQMLPWDAKLQALLEDGPILWLLALMVLLGMLLTLGLVVELWFSSKCRLLCELPP